MITIFDEAFPVGEVHWRTLYDPEDGSPYGALCHCEIGTDHDGAGNPDVLDDDEPADV
jgi:hypothetical protein